MISFGEYLEHITGTSTSSRELIDQQQWGVFNKSGSFQQEWFLFFFFISVLCYFFHETSEICSGNHLLILSDSCYKWCVQ